MQLSELEREQLYAILEKYDQHPEVQRMREFIQHGDVTTYQHCKNVVLVSFWLNRRCIWTPTRPRWRWVPSCTIFICTTGTPPVPFTACAACLRCTASPTRVMPASMQAGVQHHQKGTEHHSSHMWPLTFRHVPTCREAVIVCLADKYCAVVESMFQRARVADRWMFAGPQHPALSGDEKVRHLRTFELSQAYLFFLELSWKNPTISSSILRHAGRAANGRLVILYC